MEVEKIELKRNWVGFGVFTSLAVLHLAAPWRLFNIFMNDIFIDWLEVIVELFQLVTLALYIAMLFVPMETKGMRFGVAGIFGASLVLNMIAFIVIYTYRDFLDLLFLSLIGIDIVVIVAMIMPPWHLTNKIVPFMADPPPVADVEGTAAVV